MLASESGVGTWNVRSPGVLSTGVTGGDSWCRLLKLEGPYIIAEKGFDSSARDEDQSCTVVVGGRADGDTKFARGSVFPVAWSMRYGGHGATKWRKELG